MRREKAQKRAKELNESDNYDTSFVATPRADLDNSENYTDWVIVEITPGGTSIGIAKE